MALLDKVTDSEGVLVGVATGKALVGHVEERKVILLLDDIRDLLPLLLAGVDTSRVVSTSVEEEGAAVRSSLHIGEKTLKVKTNGVLVVVAVLLDLKTGVVEDGLVVSPRGSGNVDLLLAGEKLGEESSADTESTSAGDGLGDDDTVEGGAVSTVG